MANVAVIVIVLLLIWYIISFLRRRGHGIVAKRGLSVGADLGSLADKPRVRVRAVTKVGPGRFHLVLTPEPGPSDGPDLDLVVYLQEEDFGFELLHEWKRSSTSVALVIPPGSHIVRLRSIDDLQPLTLRRADDGSP